MIRKITVLAYTAAQRRVMAEIASTPSNSYMRRKCSTMKTVNFLIRAGVLEETRGANPNFRLTEYGENEARRLMADDARFAEGEHA